jgi:hypothetical protein
MNSVEKPSWGPPAAYLYILKLDAALWAWEYLRRNLKYRRDYDCASTGRPPRSPRSWGLASWENPREDGRTAEPQWLIGEDPEILLRPGRAEDHPGPLFDFWAIQGQKSLRNHGDHLSLTVRAGSEVLRRVQLANDLWIGDPVAISVTGVAGIVARAHAAQRLLRSLQCGSRAALPERPSLTALTHMQTLRALDGDATGASQREIARALFGPSADLSWGPDSRWRARVRYLVRCGRARCEEGYRRIVGSDVRRSPRDSAVPHGSLTAEAIAARSAV